MYYESALTVLNVRAFYNYRKATLLIFDIHGTMTMINKDHYIQKLQRLQNILIKLFFPAKKSVLLAHMIWEKFG